MKKQKRRFGFGVLLLCGCLLLWGCGIEEKSDKKVKELEFDYYVTGHYIEVYEKSMIDELIQCIEESFEKKAYSYHYPGPYHEPGKICVGDAARGIGLIY